MEGQTTYGKSFMEVDLSMKGKPIMPRSANLFPYGGEFIKKTNYRETFQRRNLQEPVIPIIPPGNIFISDKQMSSDTTSKVLILIDRIPALKYPAISI